MSIKINRAKNLAVCGRYHRTWLQVIAAVPDNIVGKLNSTELAQLADSMWLQYQAGTNAE